MKILTTLFWLVLIGLAVAGDSSIFVSQSVPAIFNVGETKTASVTFQNSGDTTWTEAGFIRLGSENPRDNLTWGAQRWFLPAGASIAPGQSVTFQASMTAPSAPGNYNFQSQLVHDFVAWFGVKSPNIVVSVTGTTPPLASFPVPTSDLKELQSFQIFNTGPYTADGVWRTIPWTFQGAQPIYIRSAYVWSGVDIDMKGDVHAQLNRIRGTDRQPLIYNQWDHYAEPTAPNNGLTKEFKPYLRLNPNDTIEMFYFAQKFSGSGSHAHHVATIWFNYTP